MKKVIMISGIILLAFVGILLFFLVSTVPKNAGDFSVDGFAEYTENEHFQTDKNYGKITDYKSAASAGKTAIAERFENSEGSFLIGCVATFDTTKKTMRIMSAHFTQTLM